MKKNQLGFGIFGTLVALFVLLLISFSGWYVWSQQSKPQTSDTQKTTTKPDRGNTQPTNTLVIKEWGVVLTSASLPHDATYRIISDNLNRKPNAFLSTQEADNNKKCQDYYSVGSPSFQYIERYEPEDKVAVDEGTEFISILDAAKRMPDYFKVVDGKGYLFKHGNGMPCRDQDYKLLEAFKDGFSNLSASN